MARMRRSRGIGVVAAAVSALVVLSACATGSGPQHSATPDATAQPVTPSAGTGSTRQDGPPLTVVALTPRADKVINPVTPITVSVTHGTLSTVELTNAAGTRVKGALATGGTSWHSSEDLGYGKTYSLSAVARNAAGVKTVTTAKYRTLTPGNQTMAYLNTTGGTALQDGATYGVGIVPVVHFDERITNRKAAEQALHVTTSPHVDGSWYWIDDSTVHWRPRKYYQSGTKVTVSADIYGVQVGDGLYGQADTAVSFKIGVKHVSIADDKTHQVSVYFNDKLQRKMPTSMGQGGYVTGDDGQRISLWTMKGTYTVIGHGDPVLMDSSTFGLPVNSPKGYKEYIYLATQISTDGIYLHRLDSTVWAQGSRDLSHGCLNLNADNAKFFYDTSQIGDVVQVINTTGPSITVGQNGDWSVPWSTWVAGSALH
jgi:lipoprotein-anchoring transpeptidase ErfK/SrfK